MRILSIETSCDETAIAILECSGGLEKPTFKELANELLSQIELHAEYGGVFPMLAKREHEKNLPIILENISRQYPPLLASRRGAGDEVDLIAVTRGPGLEPALWTGVVFAEELGKKWGKPVIGVNHMEGHIMSVVSDEAQIEFPALALLVSGGHTELVHMKNYGEYEVIGQTRDDAVGEAFDKVARLLGLPYPGGPKVSLLAEIDRAKHADPEFIFPRPMIRSNDLDFSFSGLKTALLYKTKNLKEKGCGESSELSEDQKEALARGFEDAAIDVLVDKTERAFERFEARSFIVGGGVAANSHLTAKLAELALKLGVPLLKPGKGLSGDNAIMIGMAGYIQALRMSDLLTLPSLPLSAQGTLSL